MQKKLHYYVTVKTQKILYLSIILFLLVINGCSARLEIKPDAIDTLTPTFKFYWANTNAIQNVKINYFKICSVELDGNIIPAWEIAVTKTVTINWPVINNIKYGVVPYGYIARVEAIPLEWNKKYEIGSALISVNNAAVFGGAGTFILKK